MQAACPGGVFDVLRADFGVRLECFASPLNARFPAFCSAAADVDAPFGSVGSFFTFTPRAGAYVANPPFEPALVSAMAARMEALLGTADRSSGRLTFIVVIPRWPEKRCWQELSGSPHTTCEVR